MSALATFARNDARNVGRDPFLLLMLSGPPVLVALQRFGAAPLARRIGEAGLDVTDLLPMLPGFLLCMLVPYLLGAMAGLMLLEERDEGTLLAVRVTPVALGPLVACRTGMVALASGALVGAGAPLTGLVDLSPGALAATALLAALLATFPALLLPAFASNKVEGLAALKAAGLPLLAPVGAWFVDWPWEAAFAIVPSYWPAAALWSADAGDPAWPYLLIGAAYLSALAVALWHLLRVRVERA